MPERSYTAFFSYVHRDDEHDGGRLTRLRERLEEEVRAISGDSKFEIFQDSDDLSWGDQWEQRIHDALDRGALLIVAVTPRWLNSDFCRREFERFLAHEKRLGREDLILPLLYLDTPAIYDDKIRKKDDAVAAALASRQYADWRDLRHEPWTSPEVGKRIEKLARMIAATLEHSKQPAKPSPDAGEKTSEKAPTEPPKTAGKDSPAPLEKASAGPAARKEPPTLVVDPFPKRGDHTRIADAIRAAEPGTRILVRPGLYREALVIDKPIELIGDGPREDITIEAGKGNAIRFQTEFGRISNLTLRQTAAGKYYCVDIAQGRLELEECDISSDSLTCVAIHDGADPRLRRNRIHGCKEGGVFVYDNGKGTIEDNEICETGLSGIAVRAGGDPTVRRNRVHQCKSSGLYVYDEGRGTLEDNEVWANELTGLAIKSGGDPEVRRNRIHDGNSSGVFIYEQGRGTLEENDIWANRQSGIAIASGAEPVLRRNKVHDGREGGIFVYESGLGTIEDNEIWGNALAGLEIKSGGDPTVRGNRIRDGQTSGVHVYEQGRGTLEDNDITGNTFAGVEIKSGGDPTMRKNRITGGKAAGVFIHSDGLGTFEENTIRENAYAGVEVREGGAPVLRGNLVIQNGYQGIWVYDRGGGTYEKNDLTGNKKGAWLIDESSKGKVKKSGNKES